MGRRKKLTNDQLAGCGCLGALLYLPIGVIWELGKMYGGFGKGRRGGRRRRRR